MDGDTVYALVTIVVPVVGGMVTLSYKLGKIEQELRDIKENCSRHFK